MDFAEVGLTELITNFPYLLASLVILWVARVVRNLHTAFDDDKELFVENNGALGIATAGYYMGVLIAITGVLTGPSAGFVLDMRDMAVYGALAIVLLNIARVVTDKLLLSKFDIDHELIVDKNDGTGWAMFGVYFAIGMIVRGSVGGESESFASGVVSTLVYFVLAQVILIVAGWVYQWMTPYDFHYEIGEKNNVAAGIAFAGFISAIGVVVGSAALSSVTVGLVDVVSFFVWAGVSLLVMMFANSVVTERIFAPGHKIGHEISVDQNQAAAWLSVASYQSMAWIFIFAI